MESTKQLLDLELEYNLDNLTQLPYFSKSWAWHKTTKILITGVNSWLGHYLLDLFCDDRFDAQIIAADQTPAPSYLSFSKYHKIRYVQVKHQSDSLQKFIEELCPNLIFHSDAIYDVTEENFSKLYRYNIHQTECICKAALNCGVNRVIMFSEASIYGPGDTTVSEKDVLAPQTPLAKSFWEAERIAESFHQPEQLEIYHLRIPAVFGPKIFQGAMSLVYLMLNGILLAAPENKDRPISVFHGKNVALAAALVAAAPQPGYRVFNVAGKSMSQGAFLEELCKLLPKRKILGMDTRLAKIFGIGYQSEISLPQHFFEFLGEFSSQTTHFFNQLRFDKHMPRFTRLLVYYAFNLRALSNKRLKDMLGWIPSDPLEGLQKSIEYGENTHWQIFDPKIEVNSHADKVLVPLFDETSKMIKKLSAYSPESETISEVNIPVLNVTVDLKSLWILVNRAWSYFPSALMRKEKKHSSIEFLGTIYESVMMMAGYEQNIAKRLHPDNLKERTKSLFQKMGEINSDRVQFYGLVSIVSNLLLAIHKHKDAYAPFAKLLPDKTYGLFLTSKVGDIGIIIKVKNGTAQVQSLRKEIDDFPRSHSFLKKFNDFKKMTNGYVVGIRLEQLLKDVFSGNTLEKFLDRFGTDYIFGDTDKDYWKNLGSGMRRSPVTHYMFLNRNKEVEFGIRIQHKKLMVVSNSYIQMINRMLEEIGEHSQISNMISQASEGREEISFVRIRTAKRLLAALMSTSRVSKIILRFARRVARL